MNRISTHMNMKTLQALIALLRLNKPIGIMLLWYPTAWSLWLANQGTPPYKLILYFLGGTIIMRSAGCIINDIADRHIDAHVARTQKRPLASGQLSLNFAFIWLVFLLFMAFLILTQLPVTCFFYALISLVFVMIYPFCKRWIKGPQLVLGLAFSMGIPMAYAASGATLNLTTYLLICLNICWVVSYDTIYALADIQDDLEIGVKSSAIWFGQYVLRYICGLQITTQMIWLILAWVNHLSWFFYAMWFVTNLLFLKQQIKLRSSQPDHFKIFYWNHYYGLCIWLGLLQGFNKLF